MTLDNWRKDAQYFSYRAHQIFYREAGSGPALLLIHGFPTASWDWHHLWETLTAHFRVIAADMIGFGLSDKPRGYDYSIFDQAELHEQLMIELGISKVHILSHDYGDTVAQELLARQQDRRLNSTLGLHIHSLCLLNGGLFPGAYRPRLIQQLLMSPIGGILSRLLTKDKLRSNFRAIFGPNTPPSETEIDIFWELITYQNGKNIAHKLIRYMHERQKHYQRWGGALQGAQIPLRLIDGAFDPISGRHMAERYRQLVPNPDIILLEEVGHYPQVEAPQQVLKHYFDFFRSLNQSL